MGYVTAPNHVRMDYYRPSGKWYATETLVIPDGSYVEPDMFAMLRREIEKQFPGLLSRYIVSVRKPYHQHGHPALFVPKEPDHAADHR